MARVGQPHLHNGLVRKPLFIVIAMLLAGGMQAALACGYAPGREPKEEELLAKAAVVLAGRISVVDEVKIERASASSPPAVTVEGTVRVEEVLKGTPPADNKIKATVLLGCGMLLQAGVDYLIFLDPGNVVLDGGIPGSNAGALPLRIPGMKDAFSAERLLGKVRKLAKKDAD